MHGWLTAGVGRSGESPFLPLARVGPTTPTRAGRLFDASVDPTDARKVVQELLDAASSAPLVSAWWEHHVVAWHSPTPNRSAASQAVQVRAGRRLQRCCGLSWPPFPGNRY